MKKVIKIFIIIAILVIISVIIIKSKNDEVIICIDAGHGGTDAGAVLGDRYEKHDTLKVAKLVKTYLEENNIKVIMTRNNDSTVSLKERCKMANKAQSDIFVSIHRNSAEDANGNGIEIWTNSKKHENDIELANTILNNFENTQIQNNRGVKSGTAKGENTDYYVLKNTKMTSCLIELGFITDVKDNELFDKYIEDYAKAIADGIIDKIKDND